MCALTVIGLAAGTAVAQTTSSWEPLRADGNGVATLQARVTVDARDLALADVLRSILRQTSIDLAWSSDLQALERPVSLRIDSLPAAAALLRVLENTGLRILVSPGGQAVLVAGDEFASAAGAIRGSVTDPQAGAVAEAEITLAGTRFRASSRRDGGFEIRDVPPGRYTVHVQRFGYLDAQDTVVVGGNGIASLEVSLTPAPTPIAAVIVTPGVFGVMQETLVPRQTLTRTEIETQPQLGDDIFRSIARLPGVSSMDLSAAFGLRGGSNDEVLIRLDGLELIEPYHLRDLDDAISIVDIDAVGGVDLITGGFDARFGNRLSGVFDMRSTTVPAGPPRTTLGLSLTSMRAATRGSFARDRGRWLLSARRGYIDLALDLGGSDNEFSPTFYDVFGKVEYAFGDRFALSAHVLFARDLFSQIDDEGGDPDVDTEYGSTYGWLTFDAAFTDNLESRMIAAVGRLRTDRLGMRERDRFHGAIDVSDQQAYDFASFRQEWSWQTSDRALTRFGFDARGHDAAYEYVSSAETFHVANGERFIATDTTTATSRPDGSFVSAWISQRWRPWTPFTFEAGVRWDRQTHTSETHVSPRLGAAVEIGGRTTLRAAWGRYAQGHALHDLDVEDGFTTFSRAERGEHRILGIEHRFTNELRARLEAYDMALTDLRPRTVSLDGTLEFFPELTTTRRRIDPTEGYSRGIEVMLNRRTVSGLDWAISYALASAMARIDGEWRPRPHDQRHTFGFDVALRSGPSWRFAAAWKYHSGWPNTPATLVADSAGEDILFTRIYEEYNTGRMSAYHRLDLRVSRHIDTRRGRLLLFLDLFNAYGRANPRAEYPYPIFLNNRILTGSGVDTLLPRLPSFGITWEF